MYLTICLSVIVLFHFFNSFFVFFAQDLLKTVNELGKFLDKPPSPELAAGIAELCTFDKMKKEKLNAMNNPTVDEYWKKGFSFYRKGKNSM